MLKFHWIDMQDSWTENLFVGETFFFKINFHLWVKLVRNILAKPQRG